MYITHSEVPRHSCTAHCFGAPVVQYAHLLQIRHLLQFEKTALVATCVCH